MVRFVVENEVLNCHYCSRIISEGWTVSVSAHCRSVIAICVVIAIIKWSWYHTTAEQQSTLSAVLLLFCSPCVCFSGFCLAKFDNLSAFYTDIHAMDMCECVCCNRYLRRISTWARCTVQCKTTNIIQAGNTYAFFSFGLPNKYSVSILLPLSISLLYSALCLTMTMMIIMNQIRDLNKIYFFQLLFELIRFCCLIETIPTWVYFYIFANVTSHTCCSLNLQTVLCRLYWAVGFSDKIKCQFPREWSCLFLFFCEIDMLFRLANDRFPVDSWFSPVVIFRAANRLFLNTIFLSIQQIHHYVLDFSFKWFCLIVFGSHQSEAILMH